MPGWIWIALIFLVIIVLIASFFFYAFIYGLSNFFAPNREIDSVKSIKRFLEFDFGEDFSILNHSSFNNQPDRPLEIVVSISAESMAGLKDFLKSIRLENQESLSDDKKIRYKKIWISDETTYLKGHSASHINSGGSEYEFFIARLAIDTQTKTLSYSETGM